MIHLCVIPFNSLYLIVELFGIATILIRSIGSVAVALEATTQQIKKLRKLCSS